MPDPSLFNLARQILNVRRARYGSGSRHGPLTFFNYCFPSCCCKRAAYTYYYYVEHAISYFNLLFKLLHLYFFFSSFVCSVYIFGTETSKVFETVSETGSLYVCNSILLIAMDFIGRAYRFYFVDNNHNK